MTPPWLTVNQGTAPLLVSMPHTGIDLAGLDNRLVSSWLGQRDCDWWIDKLYDFAAGLGATVVHTAISRTVIDVNRDPSGASLYPGQATTGLCPTETFDGDPLYRTGEEPGPSEIDERRRKFFMPYHAALQAEIDRLRGLHGKIVLYDCHSIRSVLPRLFDGTLPVFNLGTNDGKSTDPALQEKVAGILAETGETFVVNGRFKGGWITRHFGQPQNGVHALQMELSNRGYMREPEGKGAPDNWPVPYDAAFAAPIRATLTSILETAISWVES
ncbi:MULTISPECIES: N-formylglutamate deformylase [unclassified Mesorhizobium]|uniref:N-formylglutamate deformylase n=1 Tax=unclassified Mesorhizobium TaxID=325217 RepID=UPI001128A172|nr:MULTISPECIES: N-formylglutamate deformylase [unclassified Mesorhizobium]MBZ9704174.1 N-formylglutamate deformylase [Mesorhizobium sp. CO1-1-3]MBZ9949588.1 N-formylglutamate deformylase [Mesorhizobium sp. BR1-1-11]MCA0023146.1 N-formylglutamate deformylase [Mesorhizobium sp. B263B1A]TPI97196.1 N-formylglutamate deformylase [Mesorhizobium sp. B2-8-1]TPJ98934.1 N-formylglutamate deformylase [Mesorhizobium sp. B2-5-12]